ncbi:hypothetical protein J3E72DRAFT_391494 [Bipolaris maydis]|nr:hypothetical protein J3E73DRAFT_252484 [Bipolaris maydis]KAJ5060452.1 hypothetical protein J3E74DRAFT_428662 [Bipolaris maydis]KAJ6201718.1 hypothetical protein J3E72DRAFT_391494 [Bipolaris maydis]KAJ6211259.1 hypothetical protein PSV09DRAFT_2256594 [Bipolaris maydis]
MASSQSSHVIIDPTGDSLITLESPGRVFALWMEPLDTSSDSEDVGTEDLTEELDYEDHSDGEELPNWMRWDESDPEYDVQEQSKQQNGPMLSTIPGIWTHGVDATSAAIHPAKPSPSLPIIYQVSSAHLITASPKFGSELLSLRDSQKDSNSLYHIKCLGWDPEAFEILLNTLHTRYRRVPKQLSLEMLTKIAVMVDYYECWEAFELISQTWIRHIRVCHPMPQTYSRDLMLWMLVTWVFKLPKEFTRATAVVLRQCTESRIQDMGLGIPPSILRMLEARRSEAIEQIIETFNSWIDEFSDTYTCQVDADLSFECSSILLGALMKQMRNVDVLSPQVVAPFDGFSLEKVHENIKAIQSPIWETYDGVNELYPIKHACGFQGTIIRDVGHIVARAKGLVLNDFLDCSENMEGLSLDCP